MSRYNYLDKVSPSDTLTDEVNLRLLAYEKPDKYGYLPSFKVRNIVEFQMKVY